MAEITTHLGHLDPKTPRIPPRLPCKGITNILSTKGSSILCVIVSGEPRKNILFKCQHQVKTKSVHGILHDCEHMRLKILNESMYYKHFVGIFSFEIISRYSRQRNTLLIFEFKPIKS